MVARELTWLLLFFLYIHYTLTMCTLDYLSKLTQATDTITTSARLAFLLFLPSKNTISLYLPPYLSNNFIILLFFFMIIIIIFFSVFSTHSSALSLLNNQPTQLNSFLLSFFYSFLHSTLYPSRLSFFTFVNQPPRLSQERR